ncbi:MAG: hypothetical protein HZB15_15765, partial [Actinobacteria bacterium]|nr:hypothetical protein [Actinomycetota bacterium]
MTTDDLWLVCWETGPDAGATWTLRAGPHLVGRAPHATVRSTDPALEPFHADLSLDHHGPVVRQLAGRLPLRHHGPDEHRVRRVGVGHSVLAIRSGGAAPQRAHGPGSQRTVLRTPRQVPRWAPEPVRIEREPAPPKRPAGGLAPAVVALVVTAVMAVVVRQLMFVMFGAVGTVAALSHWVVARLGHRRDLRDHARHVERTRAHVASALDEQRNAWVRYVTRSVPTLPDACATLTTGRELWQRRIGDDDAWTVSLGLGSVVWAPVVQSDGLLADTPSCSVDDLPVAASLGPGARMSVAGPHGVALVNAMLLQLAAGTGPADWQLVVVTAKPDDWRWVGHLPHARDESGRHLVLDEAAVLDAVRDGTLTARHTVVVTDHAAGLALRTSPLRRLEATHPSLALVVVHDGAAPALCRSSVVTMSDARARLVSDHGSDLDPITLRIAAVPAASAERWAQAISACRDPEDERTSGTDVPLCVSWREVMLESGLDPDDHDSIASRWRAGGPDPQPRTPIGRAGDGVVDIDLVRDGPHALLAGTTGSGKSELMRSLVLGLSCSVSPEHLTFVLVDYKGGAAFDELRSLP